MQWDSFNHIFDLVQNGNKAFRDNRFEEVNVLIQSTLSSLACFSSRVEFKRISLST